MQRLPIPVTAFRAVYLCATLLCIANAGLVTASHLIAEHASQAGAVLGISLAVSGAFLLLGGLLHEVQRHVAGLSAEVRRLGPDVAGRMLRHLDRLLAILLVGGVLFCLALGSLTVAIVQRINEGFAVFG